MNSTHTREELRIMNSMSGSSHHECNAYVLRQQIAKLELTIQFLQGELRRQCEQKLQRQKTIEGQKATIDKLRSQLKASKSMKEVSKSMKVKSMKAKMSMKAKSMTPMPTAKSMKAK